ncbi:hypothetical protein [Nocardia alba]|uniref:Uncharacterized protein n=1 Tax=Nocardia alba TaxID=225051 RepID=A0A4R1FBM5_9NOCA|nr:hypothetical protein [Nocardia alba]TCJ90184.1 hypothetical protein DFR71_6074 [Nocardia alba]
MSTDSQSERHGHDGFAEFTEELRLLSEVLLARVEPVLRRTAADGRADLGGCAWCPVCAAAAVLRGDHHDVVAALAEHGTSMVTVLREALAGIPVEPVFPPEWAEHGARHPDSTDDHAAPATEPTGQGPHPHGTTGLQDPGSSRRSATPRPDRSGAPRPRRVDEYAAPRTARTPHITPETDTDASGPDTFAATAPPTADNPKQRGTTTREPRSPYIDIPVTIRG